MKKIIWWCILIVAFSFFGCIDTASQNPKKENNKTQASQNHRVENNETQKNSETTEVCVKDLVTTFTANFALLSDGRIFSWGENQNGVLGLGDEDTQKTISEPTQINIEEPIKEIITSSESNTIIAVANSGNIYGWGSNKYCLLSFEDIAFFSSPHLLNLNTSISNISISSRLATVVDNNGRIYGYGWKQEGPSVHFEHSEAFAASNKEFVEIHLNNNNHLLEFDTSAFYRCFLNDIGEVLIQGILVENEMIYNQVEPVLFPEKITKIGAMYQGIVALSDSGKLYFLGEDRFGIYGNDSTEYYLVYREPVLIEKFTEKVKDLYVSTGSIIVTTQSGDVYTWGYNLSKNNSESPDEVVSIPNKLEYNGTIKKCFCGEFSNIIIDENNEIYVWGSNYQNLFLNKNQESTYIPQRIDVSVFFK